MKITAISQALKNPDRVNIFVDSTFRFSLDIFQLTELGIKVGNDYSEHELAVIEQESQFGKLYARALEYCLMRPHSVKEVRDYLWRKTRDTQVRSRKTGEIKLRKGVSLETAERTLTRLIERGYVNDETFARWWIETRNQKKGSSLRKLASELQVKGVERSVIDKIMGESTRNDNEELKKVIAKKAARYDDEQKLIAYLARQGFRYDDIRSALSDSAAS